MFDVKMTEGGIYTRSDKIGEVSDISETSGEVSAFVAE